MTRLLLLPKLAGGGALHQSLIHCISMTHSVSDSSLMTEPELRLRAGICHLICLQSHGKCDESRAADPQRRIRALVPQRPRSSPYE
jgi:hypothetical protein